MATILLVCTGNICRSPMAEGFLRRELEERGIGGVDVLSCGVAGWEGSPPTPEAVQALAEYGLDISQHTASRLTRALVEPVDLVVAMAGEHRDAVSRLFPQASHRAFTLKELVHLLESAGVEPVEGSPDELLRTSVAAAQAEREASADIRLLDEDIADPLGLGIDSYRAVAWEIEGLSRRLVDGLFPVTGGASVGGDEASIWSTRSQEGSAS